MSLHPDLVARYTSEVKVDWHEAFILSHPAAGSRYIINHLEEIEGLVDGHLQVFQPVPVQITMPQRDDSGRQDAQITLCALEDEVLNFLDLAITVPTQPVVCRMSIFIEGDQAPKIDPWMELTLTQISVSREIVSAVATRADILNRTFPTEVYRVDKYPGLRRR